MTARTIVGYLVSILFIMPILLLFRLGAMTFAIPCALITLLGAWLVLKGANTRSLVKYVIIVGIFGIVGYFATIYFIASFLLFGGSGSP